MPSPFLQRQAIDDSLKVFYINLTVLDATEAVVDKVHNIMHGRRLHMPAPKAWRKAWTKTVAKRAAKHVSRKHVAKLLARKIPPRLIRTMNKRGLSVWAETVFCDHAFVVVQVQVHHVDPVVFAESGVKNQLEKELKQRKEVDERLKSRLEHKDSFSTSSSCSISSDPDSDNEGIDSDDDSVSENQWMEAQKEALHAQSDNPFIVGKYETCPVLPARVTYQSRLAWWMDWILSWLSPAYRHRMESRYLPNLIQRQLTGQTQRILRKRLRGRKIITDLQVLLEESQARYFFNHLKVVRHKKTHNMDDGETESDTSDFAEAFTGLA
jgi:protein required for attachment to host cells